MKQSENQTIDKGSLVKAIREDLGMSQQTMASILGIQQSNIANMEAGRRPVGKRISNDILQKFDVNPDWWTTGEGPMFNDNNSTNIHGSSINQSGHGNSNAIGSRGVTTHISNNSVDEKMRELENENIRLQTENKILREQLEFMKELAKNSTR